VIYNGSFVIYTGDLVINHKICNEWLSKSQDKSQDLSCDFFFLVIYLCHCSFVIYNGSFVIYNGDLVINHKIAIHCKNTDKRAMT